MVKPASNAPDIDHVLYDLTVLDELLCMTTMSPKTQEAVDRVMARLNSRATAVKEDQE